MMDKYIENLVKGAFEYDTGKLVLSEKKIELSCAPGETREGSFSISSAEDRNVHLRIYPSDPRIAVSTGAFDGNMAAGLNVAYSVTSFGLEAGDVFKGELAIISDMGEYVLPVILNVVREHLISSAGQIKNLFHFTNLARSDFDEAVRIFYTDGFESIFDNTDRNSYFKYRAFSAVKGSVANVEEFLISVNKKNPVVYSFADESLKLRQPEENVHGEVLLNRSGWGYTNLVISSDADFLVLKKESYGELDFLGNTLSVEYDIFTDKLHAGINYAAISVVSVHSCVSLPVFVEYSFLRKSSRDRVRERQKLTAELMSTYVNFRTHGIKAQEWISSSTKTVEHMLAMSNTDIEARLYQVQLLLSAKRYEEAGWILERIGSDLKEKAAAPAMRGYYLYLKAMQSGDAAEVRKAADEVWEIYKSNKNSDRLLWILLYLDEEIRRSPERERDMLERQFEKSSSSPLIYIEAYNLFADDPTLITSLSDFELHVLTFAVKHGLLSSNIESQLVILCSREKHYSESLFRILDAYYAEFEDDDMLSAICSYLIRNERYDRRYFVFFAKAVSEELKITNLYEYYVYALPAGETKILPHSVLLYFGYDNDVAAAIKAYVYANMIVHEHEIPQIMDSCRPQLLEFAESELLKRHIDENLAILFDYLKCWNTGSEDDKYGDELKNAAIDVAFRHHVICHAPGMKYVIVIEEQFVHETRAVLKDGEAYVDVCGTEHAVFFEDSAGNRYSRLDAGYELVPLLNASAVLHDCGEYHGSSTGVAVCLSEAGRSYITVNENNAAYVRYLVSSPDISDGFKREIRRGLMQYYFDADMFGELEGFLGSVNIASVSEEERNEIVRFMAARDMTAEAYDIIMTYGAFNLDPRIAVRLLGDLIEERDFAKSDELLYLAESAFSMGKYNEVMLRYLILYYEGTTRNMRNIWKAGISFDIEVVEIEERMLRQMLMTRGFVGERDDIFFDYLKRGSSMAIRTAYLSYNAYEYFVRERITDPQIFSELIHLYKEGRSLNDVCMLALIQFYSTAERDENVNAVLIRFIRNMLKRDVLFEFFRSYRDIVPELAMYDDVSLIEYRTNPRNRVVLHFVINDGQADTVSYEKEDMANMYGGIFSKRFTLFFGECLQYYITEEMSGRENLTSSGVLEVSESSAAGAGDGGESNGSRYAMINDILISRALEDYDSMDDIIRQYIRKSVIVAQVFGLSQETENEGSDRI